MQVGDTVRVNRKIETPSGVRDTSENGIVRFIYPNGDPLVEMPEYLGPNLRYQRVMRKSVK